MSISMRKKFKEVMLSKANFDISVQLKTLVHCESVAKLLHGTVSFGLPLKNNITKPIQSKVGRKRCSRKQAVRCQPLTN
jgi:hypothetical protein